MTIINLCLPPPPDFPVVERVIVPRTHTDPRKGEFTPTSLEEYLYCKRKYYYSKPLSLNTGKNMGAKDFGTAIHAGVGKFYELRNNLSLSLAEVKVEMLKAFAASWTPENEDTKRNSRTGMELLIGYADCYRNDTAHYDPSMIETELKLEMPNGTLLVMRIDRVRLGDGSKTVVDTKTSSSPLTDWYFLGFKNSFQLSAYYYAVEQVTGDCDDVQVDAIKVPADLPEKTYSRRSMMRTELQIEEFLNTYQKITDRIREDLALPEEKQWRAFHQCPTACSSFGGCSYLPICQYGMTHPDVEVMFKKGEVE